MNSFHWKKLGLLYNAQGINHPKLITHAANPLPVLRQGDEYRVFFSGRDELNRSSVGFVDIDIVQRKILRVCDRPVFEHGAENSFYSHGVSVGGTYRVGEKHYMLFMGWQTPADGHWRGDIGRLRIHDNLSLSLDPKEPYMSSDVIDPISLSYPWVMFTGNQYVMCYGSTVNWTSSNGEMIHVLKSATSKDGHIWQKREHSVPYLLGKAQAFSRPAIIGSEKEGFDMWFSYRSGSGETYRIGYAHSVDCLNWTLALASAGISPSDSGWDSEMIEYPYVFDHKGQRYMLYNGNDFGKTGFGLAILQ